jgi:hypothetical protein
MYNETEWMKMLFLLADTQSWLEDLSQKTFHELPLRNKKNLFRNNYYLTPLALVHILERHYYKIPRHPEAGKFTIPVTEILHWIREGFEQPALKIPGTGNLLRSFDTTVCIGHDQYGKDTSRISIITETHGKVKTAFPGAHPF